MKRIFLSALILLTSLWAQFDWMDNGIPLRQGIHIEWQRTGDIGSNGEMIFAWSDTRFGDRDVFIQKVDINGNALWGELGKQVADWPGRQEDPLVINDGAGGAYVVWVDYRDEPEDGDIYAQYINSDGERMWGDSGIALTSVAGPQVSPNMCYDGNGGAFVIWNDMSGSQYGVIYGTHLSPDMSEIVAQGTGVPILAGPGQHNKVSIETGGVGFANMVWEQVDGSGGSNLHAQRIDSQCNTLWSAPDENGVVVCDAEGDQFKPKINDMTNSVSVIVWEDRRDNPDENDIYLQFIDENGNTLLQNNGIPVCEDTFVQNNPRVKAEDGAAFVVWEDFRNHPENGDVYGQRITLDGQIGWEANGQPICTAPGKQTTPRLTADGQGGVYVVWMDERFAAAPEIDIFLQHLDADGTESFETDGLAMCLAPKKQEAPLVRPDGNGGAFTVWGDRRTGSIGLYVQHVTPETGITLEEDGTQMYFGIDGNTLEVASVYLGNDNSLAYWEDHRWGGGAPSTYGMIINSNYDPDVAQAFPLSQNAYQKSPQIARIGNHLFMNYKSVSPWGTILQYYQVLDINNNFNTVGDPSGQVVYEPAFPSNQEWSALVAGDDGYFYFAWSDTRFEISWSYVVFVQKYDELGVPQWQNDGVLVGNLDGDNIIYDIQAIPGGGCVVSWEQNFMGDQNIYARVVDADGSFPAGWEEPVAISAVNGEQTNLTIAQVDNGIFAAWKDVRNGNADIFGQLIRYDGTMDGPDDGFGIAVKINDQLNPSITYNEQSDEVLVCWEDFVNGSDYDIFCTIIPMSTLTPGTELPLAVYSGSGQTSPFVYTSQDGVFMAAWEDTRASLASDIYYQEILNGEFVFEPGGVYICSAPFRQEFPVIDLYSHTDNSYMVYWLDARSSGKEDLINLYIQSRTIDGGGCGDGDVNNDGSLDVLDVVSSVGFIMGTIADPTPEELFAADVNCDGSLDVLDIVSMVNTIISQ